MYVTREYNVTIDNDANKLSKTFKSIESAKEYILENKQRNEKDGFDNYWNNATYSIYRITKTIEKIKEI